MSEKQDYDPKATHTTGKTLGALGGVVALVALLIIGVSQTKSAGAEMITNGDRPSETQYSEQAVSLDYEKGILGDYEHGAMISTKGKVNKILEEPVKGEANYVLNISGKDLQNVSSVKTKQVLLVFRDAPGGINENEDLAVKARYIGTLKFETAVGTEKEVPALQVDYLE